MPELSSIERAVLTGPDFVARAAARAAGGDPAQRWMLLQPRAVRRSYATEVLDHPEDPNAEERWMLLQSDAVRVSFVDAVLGRYDSASPPE